MKTTANLYAKLRIKILELNFDKYQLRNPHIHVRLGHQVYVTPKRLPQHQWSDVFEFDVSFHQHLFWMVQIDVYDSRFFKPHSHVARAELRLYRLQETQEDDIVAPERVKLREKQHCYANLGCLNLPDRELKGYTKGTICLEIHYTPQTATVVQKETLLPLPVADVDGKTSPASVVSQSSFVLADRGWASLPAILPSMHENDMPQCKETFERKSNSRSLFEYPLTNVLNGDEHSFSSPSLDQGTDSAQDGFTEETVIEKTNLREEPVDAETLVTSREIHSLARKISGWILREEDYHAVENVLNSLAAFGQGVVVGRVALTIAYFLVQRYHRSLPVPFSNNVKLTKEGLELPRIIFKYAFAAHGWAALYFFGKRREMLSDVVSVDANYRAVLEFLSLDPTDLPICDLDQHRLFRPNFYVALDRRLKSVILSIRGTMSIRDTLTDLAFDYVPWNGGVVHSGILTSAQWFLDHLGRQLLQLAQINNMERIVVTGHSLGGATAALTTIMLSDQLERWKASGELKQSLGLHCYAFGPPPILSPEIAARYTHLIDTFVFGDDVVPRLSYGTVLDLQALTVYAAEISGAGHLFSRRKDADLHQKLDMCRSAIRAGHHLVNPKLHLPGRIHHLLTLKAPNNRKYTVVDTCGPERFCELILRRGMLSHHMPNRYERALEDAYVTFLLHELEERQCKPPTPFAEKLQSVIRMMGDEDSFRSGSGLLFPRPSGSTDAWSASSASQSALSMDEVDFQSLRIGESDGKEDSRSEDSGFNSLSSSIDKKS